MSSTGDISQVPCFQEVVKKTGNDDTGLNSSGGTPGLWECHVGRAVRAAMGRRSMESESQSKRRSDGGPVQEYGGSRSISSGGKGNSMYKAPKRCEAMRPREIKQLFQGHIRQT